LQRFWREFLPFRDAREDTLALGPDAATYPARWRVPSETGVSIGRLPERVIAFPLRGKGRKVFPVEAGLWRIRLLARTIGVGMRRDNCSNAA
jgi:hypothetical protein